MSKNLYKELKNKQQQEVNNFPMFFAFSREQFEEGIKELGLTKDDRDKIHSIGAGGFIKRSDSEAMNEMFSKHEKEIKEAIINDQTGEGFIYDMFKYELNNHEYGYTGIVSDAIAALGLTMKDINKNEKLLHGLTKACKDIMNEED